MKYLVLLSFLILSACDSFVKQTDSEYFDEFNGNESDKLQLLFSHNINGETHPCGCRNFPLGGLPQAYGIIKSESSKAPTIYFDTGDTFFPSPVVADFLLNSSKFTAENIAEALSKSGLNFMTLGDQDFALGVEFLATLQKKYDLNFLLSNANDNFRVPHKKFIHIPHNKLNLFFIGIVEPSLLRPEYRGLFIEPKSAIKRQLELIEEKFPNQKNKKIILLSHSGLDNDRALAKVFPVIDWIVGAHSQSYLRFSEDIGKTQIAQVLSRNHFIGKITLNQKASVKDKYEIIESRDETQNLVKENPMIPWLSTYKTKLNKLQEEEQNSIGVSAVNDHLPTAVSCIECHTKQGEFWQGTAHSISFKTLIDAKAANNTSCVGCHSLGYKDQKGYLIPKKIILSENEKFNIEEYWKEFNKEIKLPKKSIREMSSVQRRSVAQKWTKIDSKHKVEHNFANVQCLNCHVQTQEHPFDTDATKVADYKNACLNCHTKDQSPEWYLKDKKGLAGAANSEYIAGKIKEVSCPKIEKD